MKPVEVFLLLLRGSGGSIRGKTLAQKRGYFLDYSLKLGLGFRPHYYGPYSPVLDEAIGSCVALGFADERTIGYGTANRQGFEVRRFDYMLTDDGEKVVAAIVKRNRNEAGKICNLTKLICESDENDYLKLSVAAKVIYILDREECHDSVDKREHIKEAARAFNWDISDLDLDKAVAFLNHLMRLLPEDA